MAGVDVEDGLVRHDGLRVFPWEGMDLLGRILHGFLGYGLCAGVLYCMVVVKNRETFNTTRYKC